MPDMVTPGKYGAKGAKNQGIKSIVHRNMGITLLVEPITFTKSYSMSMGLLLLGAKAFKKGTNLVMISDFNNNKQMMPI